MKYKAIVFDLDGTILNTLDDLRDSVNHALAVYGLPEQSHKQMIPNVGNGVRYLVEKSVPGGESYPQFEQLFAVFRKHYAENCCNKTRPFDGIIPVMEKFKTAGVKMAVITNKFQSAADDVCGKYFPGLLDVVLGEVPGMPRKPAPDIVFKALSKMGIALEDAAMFGDSDTDEKTAQNANISHCAVLWGFRTREQLLAAGAKNFISRPEEMIDFIEGKVLYNKAK